MAQEKLPGKNKGGRPPKDAGKKKTKIITLKCTAYDKQVIQGKARILGVSVSELLIATALNRQVDSGFNRQLRIPSGVLLEIKGQLGPIGNNLNQLLKTWHTRSKIFTAEDRKAVMELCESLRKILNLIEDCLQ